VNDDFRQFPEKNEIAAAKQNPKSYFSLEEKGDLSIPLQTIKKLCCPLQNVHFTVISLFVLPNIYIFFHRRDNPANAG